MFTVLRRVQLDFTRIVDLDLEVHLDGALQDGLLLAAWSSTFSSVEYSMKG